VRSIQVAEGLALSSLERLRTREEIVSFGALAATGLLSSLWAGLLPPEWGIWAGFFYGSLAISMPLIATFYERKAGRLEMEQAAGPDSDA